MSEKKIRISLWAMVSIIILLVFAFLWAININQPDSLRMVLNRYIVILCTFAIASMAIFFFVAPICGEDGTLERNRILVITTAMLVIGQMAFAFASYSYTETVFSFQALNNATSLYQEMELDHVTGEQLLHYAKKYEEIDLILVLNEENRVIVASDESFLGNTMENDPLTYYSIPMGTGELRMRISESAKHTLISNLLAELLTIMAASIFLTIELILFVLKVVENKMTPVVLIDGKKPCQALEYIRPLAFVFYFSSRIASSFIPLVAQEMEGNFLGVSGNMLTSIPQSSETLFTCVAIFFTSMLLEKKGWKLPFIGGVFLVAGGTLLSGLATHIVMFILARSLVGLGYGFSWMTLRNISLFGRNQEEKAVGFSLLNAGIYAGMNCGSVLGSILAESFGYQTVFMIATIFTLICSLVILRMENAIYQRPIVEKKKQEDGKVESWKFGQVMILALFVILMIAPASIAGSYLSYYLPIYFIALGHSLADVGRAQLLYGVMIIYVGPHLAKMTGLKQWTYLYSILIAGTFIVFGLFGGFGVGMLAVLVLGIGDSFGFVLQNNYFLNFKILQKMGESASLSMLSFLKKMSEMIGPMTFALFMNGINTTGIFVLGSVFLVGTLIYLVFCSRKAELLECI